MLIPQVFLGNDNADSFVTQEINPSIHARFIRIQPTSWHGRICLRTELYGCLVEVGTETKSKKTLILLALLPYWVIIVKITYCQYIVDFVFCFQGIGE